MHTRISAFTAFSLLLMALLRAEPAIPSAAAAARPSTPPIAFQRNVGQTDSQVHYLARGAAATLFLTQQSAVWKLAGGSVMRLVPVGGRPAPRLRGEDQLPGQVNIFQESDPANWRHNVPIFGRVRYENVFPGVDWVFHSNKGDLEYDFVVAPESNPADVRLRWEGADSLSIDEHGSLVASVGGERVWQKAPLAYQARENTSEKAIQEVAARFVLHGEQEFGFEVGAYDRAREIVIDPEVVFSSYLGGSAQDHGRALAVDSEDNVYIAGWTLSADFPTANALQPARAANVSDVFVTKISNGGSTIVYSTYLGGISGDQAYDIAVDSQGAAYVVGNAGSGFPVTNGAVQTGFGNVSDAFVAKLSPNGSTLVYSTYLGGGRADDARGVAVDEQGNAYVAGRTASDNFPVTANSFGPTRAILGNENDAWAAKLNSQGTQLIYSGYLGGTDSDTGAAIAVHEGRAHVTGSTASANFPTTVGAYSRTHAGTTDIFVTKIRPDGAGFEFSTFVGGANVETAAGIDIDVVRNVYVTGSSVSANFPTTPGSFQPQRVFGNEVVVFKLPPDGSTLTYSTHIGTSAQDRSGAIAVDRQGHAHITGETTAANYPAVGALQGHGGVADSFVTRMNFAGSALLYSSLLGGSGAEQSGRDDSVPYGKSIAVNENCEVFVTGITDSQNFPTKAPFQAAAKGDDDGFVAKFDLDFDNGSPTIFCNGAVLAPLSPTIQRAAPRAIGTVFGRDFSTGTVLDPQLDGQGKVATNLAGVCVEIDSARGPVFAVVAGKNGQVNFGYPVETTPGWHAVRVVKGCGTAQEVRSEPQFVLVEARAPQFFNFVNQVDGVNPIAAVNETQGILAGPADLFGGQVQIAPAKPGDYVTVYPTGFGATDPPLTTGQIPGGIFSVTGQVEVRLGGRVIPPADIVYAGAAPCCAGLDQLTFRVPPDMPPGQHQLIITIDGVASPQGPFLVVGQP